MNRHRLFLCLTLAACWCAARPSTAQAEAIDFNDISLVGANPSYAANGTTVTGYYLNGPTANAVPGTDQYGDPTLDGTYLSGSPAAVQLGNSECAVVCVAGVGSRSRMSTTRPTPVI